MARDLQRKLIQPRFPLIPEAPDGEGVVWGSKEVVGGGRIGGRVKERV